MREFIKICLDIISNQEEYKKLFETYENLIKHFKEDEKMEEENEPTQEDIVGCKAFQLGEV